MKQKIYRATNYLTITSNVFLKLLTNLKVMQRLFLLVSLFYFLLINAVIGQKPEKQISFARESKPLSYYVEQAELWAKELQKDSLSEANWYNYFRACRNANGAADWRSDFVNESPFLMHGHDIVNKMEAYIPNTFTYYYLSYLTFGVGVNNYSNLLKAFEMNPDFDGIHSSMVSFAESSNDYELRKKVNKLWYKTNYFSHQELAYSYNVLMSLDSNAILLTQHDNDTYPAWLLQDALGIRDDVFVINIDFLLFEKYRNFIYNKLNIQDINLGEVDINEYRSNWSKVTLQILKGYNGNRPLYVGMTLSAELYKELEKDFYDSGLALRFSKKKLDLDDKNLNLYKEIFFMDYLKHSFVFDSNQKNINFYNLNYIRFFKNVFDIFKRENNTQELEKLRNLSLNLASKINNPEYYEKIKSLFS